MGRMQANRSEDLVPISDMGEGSRHVRDVLRTGRPKVVTEDGVGVAVIVGVEAFEALRAESAARGLLEDLRTAIAEADAGGLVDHDEVVAGLRERRASRSQRSRTG